jgi:hypothetical protein
MRCENSRRSWRSLSTGTPGNMRELGPVILALIGVGAIVVTLLLSWWLIIHVNAELDRRDPANSVWLIISSRYRRLGVAVASLYVVAAAILVLATILAKYLR